MQSTFKRITILGLLFAGLASFSIKPGGEGFRIFLNNKLVLEKFGGQMNTVSSIQLDPAMRDGQLSVNYFHCGQTGKNRAITIRNEQNIVLKEWRFANLSAAHLSGSTAMTFKISDVLNLSKKTAGKLNLFYTSSELPDGRLLASIVTTELVKSK